MYKAGLSHLHFLESSFIFSVENVLTKNKEEFTTALGIRDDTKEEIATLQEQVKEVNL